MQKHINIQFFAEGGAAGAAGEGAQDAGAQTQQQRPTTGSKRGQDLSGVVYGTQPTGAQPVQDTPAEQPAQKTSFDDLLKDDAYKAEYDRRVQAAIQNRFRENTEAKQRSSQQDAILAQVAARYKLQAGPDGKLDLNALQTAMDADTSGLEDEALERGMSVDTLAQLKQLERRNAQQKAELDQFNQEQQQRAAFQSIIEQADALKETFPNLDIMTEMADEGFRRLVLPPHMGGAGMTVENAYAAMHYREMIGAGMQAAQQKAAQQVANAVKAGANRPLENGARTAKAVAAVTDPGKLTHADFEEIRRRAARGEKITFE